MPRRGLEPLKIAPPDLSRMIPRGGGIGVSLTDAVVDISSNTNSGQLA